MSLDTVDRARVVAEARRWIGTPYHACADLRGIGVDCGMLIVRIYVDLGLLPPFDPRPYPADWHLHRGEERYLDHLREHCRERWAPKRGDVATFRYGRCWAHGAIVTREEPLTVIHAFSPAGCVLEEVVERNAALCAKSRAPRFFTLWSPTRDGGR